MPITQTVEDESQRPVMVIPEPEEVNEVDEISGQVVRARYTFPSINNVPIVIEWVLPFSNASSYFLRANLTEGQFHEDLVAAIFAFMIGIQSRPKGRFAQFEHHYISKTKKHSLKFKWVQR